MITRLLAWKPRWAVIMFVNSCARSTFDISTAPGDQRAEAVRAGDVGRLGAGVVGGDPVVAGDALEAGVVRELRQRDDGDLGDDAGGVGHR